VRRLLASAALVLVALAPAGAAWAGNPHHEETDGCDHGATSVPCRPDPSPNGKDCDPHGQHGGVNEDHCQPATSTTTTTTQEDPTSTTTTTTLAPTTTTTSSVPSSPGPTTTSTTPSSSSTPTASKGGSTSSTPGPSTGDPELPRTGAPSLALAILGAWLVLGGLAALLIGATIREGGR
jgi:hypothetical protein